MKWTVCLLVSLLLAVVECQVLDIRMYPTPGDTYCGNLQCVAHSSLPVIAMTIYDITEKDTLAKLVSILIFSPELSIEQSQIHLINATGAISENGGILSINFTKAADCLYRSFQCELDFVDANGKPDGVNANLIGATEQNATELCTLPEIAAQLKALQQDNQVLKAMLGSVILELSRVEGLLNLTLNTQHDQRFWEVCERDRVSSSVYDVLKQLIVKGQSITGTLKQLGEAGEKACWLWNNVLDKQWAMSLSAACWLWNDVLDKEGNMAQIPFKPLGSVCYRDMPHKNTREKFLLYGNVLALCDTETDGGGWVVIQRRVRGDVDFYRGWDDYKRGFGTPDTDFWIGNDIIHNLTSQGYNELRIDFVYNGTDYFAQYKNFSVADESSNYRITISGYSENSYDNMAFHNGRGFSTPDRDNDLNNNSCSVQSHGSWWYNDCYNANLNGAWAETDLTGIVWTFNSTGTWGTLTFTEMKIRYI